MVNSSELDMIQKGKNICLYKGLTTDNEKQATRAKELPAELKDSTVSRHRCGEDCKRKSVVLKVPKNTAASKLNNWTNRALVKEVTKNPMVTLAESQRSHEEM